jgi:serine/threonine protein kinase
VSASDSTRIGAEVAGYRIEALLGRGGMSVVYLAEHMRLGRKVALKLLASVLSEDEGFRDRFVRESRRAAELDHPNIVPIYDAGEADGQLYIAMRYVEGCDLKTLIGREERLSTGRTLYILEQVASALDTAHDHDLIHRDVKPANILIAEPSEMVYLADFGVVKHTASRGLTKTGFFIGTVDYAAPEQIEGLPVDARTDVYALGCVLYECLVGKAPFDREGEVAVMHAHLVEPPPTLTTLRPDLPKSLNRVIASAMAKSKDERYNTCEELIAAARSAALQRTSSAAVLPARDLADAREEPHPTGESTPGQGVAVGIAASSDVSAAAAPTGVAKDDRAGGSGAPPDAKGTPPPVNGGGAPPGSGRRRPPAWLPMALIALVAAVASGVAVYLLTNNDSTPNAATTTITTSTGTTTSTTSTTTSAAPVALIAALMPTGIAAQCKTQATPSYDAVETELCHPPANAPTSFPTEFSFSFFRSHAALLASYDSLKSKLVIGACGGTVGEKAWIHPSTGKTGGARICGNADNGDSMILWTHERRGSFDHVDMLGVARTSSRGANLFRSWWNAVKDDVGKCRPLLAENVCYATTRHFEKST